MEITILEKKRKERKWTKSELARRSCVRLSVVGWIEKGLFIHLPSELKRLADALGVDNPQTLLDLVEA